MHFINVSLERKIVVIRMLTKNLIEKNGVLNISK